MLGIGVVTIIFLYQFFYNTGLNGPSWVYVTEVLPTQLRAKGTNIMQFWGTVALVYNGYVNPIAIYSITWKYYIVYICILAAEVALVYLFFGGGHSDLQW